MATYRVQVNGKEVRQYTEFQRAGRSGVRVRDTDGHTEEYSGETALSLALRGYAPPGAELRVIREDGTIAAIVYT